MAQSKPIRKSIFTLFVNDQKVPFAEIAIGLLKRVNRSEVKSLQHYGFGRYELNVLSEEAIKRLYENPVVDIQGKDYYLRYMGATSTDVSVFYYPSDEPLENLKKRMSQYGEVRSLRIGKYRNKDIDCWETGVIHLKMEIQKEIPNFVQYNDKVIQCEYQGVKRVCRKCCLEGHLSSQCKTPKCSRCGYFGHESCGRPCPRCSENHPVTQCKKKTFAAALGYLRGLTPDLDTIPVEDPTEEMPREDAVLSRAAEETNADEGMKDNEDNATSRGTLVNGAEPGGQQSSSIDSAIEKLVKDARAARGIEPPVEEQENTATIEEDSLEQQGMYIDRGHESRAEAAFTPGEVVTGGKPKRATPPDRLREKVQHILARGVRTTKKSNGEEQTLVVDDLPKEPVHQGPVSKQKKRKKPIKKASQQSKPSSTPTTSAAEESQEEESSIKESPIEKRPHVRYSNLTDTSSETLQSGSSMNQETSTEVSSASPEESRGRPPRLSLSPDTDVSTRTPDSPSIEAAV